MTSALTLPVGSQANGTQGSYLISKQLHRNIWRAVDAQTKQNVILKTAPNFPFRNERDILKRFQNISSLRRLIDEVQCPPLLVLEHLDSNLLIQSETQKLQSSEVKRVTKAVLQALAALHEEGIVHTDVKPDNILVNYGSSGSRFSGVKLADCGDSTHVDSVVEEHVIGATIFRSPEAMLNLIWGPPTVLVFGSDGKFPLRYTNACVTSAKSTKLISLIWGEGWHIFKPSNINPTDSAYPVEVLRRQDQYFGPFPLSYTSLADDDRLGTLTIITESVEKRTPFEMASSKEITKEDREFIGKLMQLDPRDRPSAKALLQDPWLAECTADSK